MKIGSWTTKTSGTLTVKFKSNLESQIHKLHLLDLKLHLIQNAKRIANYMENLRKEGKLSHLEIEKGP